MKAEEFTLSNGLRVVHLQNPSALSYNIEVIVNAGRLHDPVGKSGLSHALEHCVFMETEQLRGNGVSNQMRALGGSESAYTGFESTAFSFSAIAEQNNLYTLCDLVRQIFTEPHFDSLRVEKEMHVILNECGEGQDSFLRSRMLRLGGGIIGDDFPGILGEPDEFLDISPDDLYGHICDFYKAGNMTVYTGGPVPAKEMHTILESTLSSIPASDRKPPMALTPELRQTDIRSVNERKTQNHWLLMFFEQQPMSLKEKYASLLSFTAFKDTLTFYLREKAGCVYSPDVSLMLEIDKGNLLYVEASTHPDLMDKMQKTCIEYFADLDAIDDAVLLSPLRNALHSMRNYETWQGNQMFDLIFQDRKLSNLFDIDETTRILESINADDIRDTIRGYANGLIGIDVTGPKPDLLPSLADMRRELGGSIKELKSPVSLLKAKP